MAKGKYITDETRVALLNAGVTAIKENDFSKRDLICKCLANISEYGFVDSQNQMYGMLEHKKEEKQNANKEMSKEEYEKHLLTCVQNLRKSWFECLDVFNNIYFNCNDYIVDEYPFDKSFDEIDVTNWCDTIIEKIEQNRVVEVEEEEESI